MIYSERKKKMKYFIVTDIEGVSGVLDAPNWIYNTSKYKDKGIRLMTLELNAVIEGIFDADPDAEITAVDGHGSGAIDTELLDERAMYLNMRGLKRPFGLTEEHDAVLWVGQHARAGAKFAHLAHTGSFSTLYKKINDLESSEFVDVALCAEEMGIPVIFGGGDEAFGKEMNDLVPGAVTVAVKRGLRDDGGETLTTEQYEHHNTAAIHIHPNKARELLRAGAEKAVSKLIKEGKEAFKMVNAPKPPYTVTLRTRGADHILVAQDSTSVIKALNASFKKVNGREPRYVASPSRNFCILNYSIMSDPKDGKEKFMFTSFVSGGTGMFFIVDPIANTGESFEFPCDNGAWAVCRVDETRVAIGTCAAKGVIHTFDLMERRFIKTSKVEGNTYVWGLIKASDGKLYGGTYNGNSIVCYDPDTMEAEVVARCDDEPKNLYSRPIYADCKGSGNIKVCSGMHSNHICVYNVFEKKIVKNIPGTMVSHNSEYFAVDTASLGDGATAFNRANGKKVVYFDSATCEEIPADALPEVPEQFDKLRMADGTRVIVHKQGYKLIFPDGREEIKRFPVLPPATGIHTLVCDEKDKVWVSSGFGQVVTSLDPDTGDFVNTNNVTNNGGEVYGIVPYGDRLYFTAYNGGIHIVYYPDKEWNQEENINPNTFRLINKEGYIRPDTRSHIGPGGYIYTGFTADYGVYGGAVTKIDPETNEVTLWENKVNNHGISFLFFDKEYVYAATTTGGNGLPPRPELPTYVFKLDKDLNLVGYENIGKTYFYGKVYHDGKIYLTVANGIKRYLVIAEEGMERYELKELSGISYPTNLNYVNGKLIFSDGNNAYSMNLDGSGLELFAVTEKRIHNMAATKSGRIFVSCEEKVFELYLK